MRLSISKFPFILLHDLTGWVEVEVEIRHEVKIGHDIEQSWVEEAWSERQESTGLERREASKQGGRTMIKDEIHDLPSEIQAGSDGVRPYC